MSKFILPAASEEFCNEPKTTLVSKNITVLGHRTSIRLEPEMWASLKEISLREKCSIHELCTLVSIRKNRKTSLTAAIRVFIMLYFRSAATDDGHSRAGHGSFEQMKRRARVPEQVLAVYSKMKKQRSEVLEAAAVG